MTDPTIKLQIAFPTSSEDHRLQLMQINDSLFAVLHSSLESDGPIQLDCGGWSLILLASIKSKTNVIISGINVICLNDIESETGLINIQASNRLVTFGKTMIKPVEQFYATGKRGHTDRPIEESSYYHHIFEGLLADLRDKSVKEAQQKFITSLCLLADKIEGKEDLNIQRILDIWDIAPLASFSN